MEEIKFRAYDHTIEDYTNECFDTDLDEDTVQSVTTQFVVNTMSMNGPGGLKFTFELSSLELDNDGVEVFVGDIIKCPKGINDVIIFKQGAFWLKNRNVSLSHFLYVLRAEIEVIGNIHMNPELAEV